MIAGHAKFSFSDLEVAVGGVIQKLNSGHRFRELTIPSKRTILGQDDQECAIDLLNRAKQLCLVAAVEQKFERSRAVEGQHLIVA